MRSLRRCLVVFLAALSAAACGSVPVDQAAPTTPVDDSDADPDAGVQVLAIADLTDCRGPDGEVADLINSLPGTILMAGDLAYPDASQENFVDCFLPVYEEDLDRIWAAAGDNDYNTPGAEPFYATLADRTGLPGQGWYAVELGAWQLLVLNSSCAEVGGCDPSSDQYRWLDETLQEQSYECRIVMWHRPRFTSSANYRGIDELADLYARVHGAGADILVVGHSHHYERFAPLAPDGRPAEDGMANFTVGVGGAPFSDFGEPRPGSMVRSNESRGVLRLTLRDGGYDWDFVTVPSDEPIDDSGSHSC